jgi:hypothetical protein
MALPDDFGLIRERVAAGSSRYLKRRRDSAARKLWSETHPVNTLASAICKKLENNSLQSRLSDNFSIPPF